MARRLRRDGGNGDAGLRRRGSTQQVAAAWVAKRGGGVQAVAASGRAAAAICGGGGETRGGGTGPGAPVFKGRGRSAAWARGQRRPGHPRRAAAAMRTREESPLGTTDEAARSWALAWLRLGWPSSGRSFFYKHFSRKTKIMKKIKILYRHIIYQNFQKKISYNMNTFLESNKTHTIQIEQRVLLL